MAQYKVPYLTERQKRILAVIRRHVVEEGRSPTVGEIRAEVGLSAGGVHYQLGELVAKHAIVREPRQPRGISLL